MPGVVNPFTRPLLQRNKKVCDEKRSAIDEELGKLANPSFIVETKFPT